MQGKALKRHDFSRAIDGQKFAGLYRLRKNSFSPKFRLLCNKGLTGVPPGSRAVNASKYRRPLQAAEKLVRVNYRRFCNKGTTSVGPIKPIKSMLGFSPCKSSDWQFAHSRPLFAASLAPEGRFFYTLNAFAAACTGARDSLRASSHSSFRPVQPCNEPRIVTRKHDFRPIPVKSSERMTTIGPVSTHCDFIPTLVRSRT